MSFALLSLASLLVNVSLVGYILSKNPRGTPARLYVLLLATFILWDVPEMLVRAVPPADPARLRLLINVEWTGIALIPGVMAHFVLSYPRPSPFLARSWSLLVLYTPSIVFTSFLWGGDLLVRDVVPGPLGPSARVGALYLPLGSLYAVIIVLALAHLARAYLEEEEPRSKMRYGLLFAGFAIPTLAGTVTEVYGPFLFGTGTRLGLGSLYTTVFLAFVSYAVFRYGFLVIEPAIQPVSPGAGAGWERGRNYLVLERDRQHSFPAFRDLVRDAPGLAVTAFPPSILAEEYSLGQIPILWLTSQTDHPLVLKPTYLEVDVFQTILKFLRDNRGSSLLLDDLEYLAEVNGFKRLLRTVSGLGSAASKYGCTLVASLHPDALDAARRATLRGVFDRVHPFEREPRPEPPLAPPGAVLWEGDREACFRALSRAALGRKVLVSTLYPGKLASAYGLTDAAFLWIAATRDPQYPSYDVSRLPFEVLRDLSRRVRGGSLVYLGELDVLVEQGSFLPVLEYVKHAVDAGVSRQSLVVASVDPESVSPSRLAALERRFARRVA